MRKGFRFQQLAPGLFLAAVAFGGPGLYGQEVFVQLESQPPEIPETVVEAEQPAAAPQPSFEPYPYPNVGAGDVTPSILGGTMFDSPPVEGYRADSSTTGSIMNIPDADLPLTVNTIPRDLIDDQIGLRITDIWRNAGGVNLLGDSQFADRLLLRGQQLSSGNFRKDGFLDQTSVPREFQNVERIEILKGPASVLYGAGDAAGLVNLITKKPLDDQFANGGFTFGSFGQTRFTMDANGYVNPSGSLLYRLNGVHEDSDSFVDFDYLNRTQIAPVVTWLIDETTSLTWNGEWHRHDTIGFQGTPALGGDPLALPSSRFVGEPANDFFEGEEFRQSLVFRKELGESSFFSIGGYSLFNSAPQSTTSASMPLIPLPFPPFTPVQPEFIRQRNDAPYQDEQTHSMIANLGSEFWTGDLYHRALVGMEYAYLDSQSNFVASTPWTGGFAGPFPVPPFPAPFLPVPLPFDVTNPVYNDPDAIFLFGLETQAFRQQRVGGYLQDLVEISPELKLLGGIRFDTVDFDFDRIITQGPVVDDLETVQTFDRASPRGGVVLQPFGDESLAFYYSYSQSFSPPGGGAYFTVDPLQPVLGESHEAGIKTLLVEGLGLTACGYHIVRENDTFVLTPSVITQVGEVRSQGAEVNLLGSLTEAWSVVANYCYCDAKVFDTGLGLDGAPARNVPYNTANLWTRYNLYYDDIQTFGAALGIVGVGDRASSLIPNGIELPGYTRWDGGLYYQRCRLNAIVYLENLTDEQYAQSSVNEFQIFQGAPFNVRAALNYLY
jgi:iron complex outermembrane receptor protein